MQTRLWPQETTLHTRHADTSITFSHFLHTTLQHTTWTYTQDNTSIRSGTPPTQTPVQTLYVLVLANSDAPHNTNMLTVRQCTHSLTKLWWQKLSCSLSTKKTELPYTMQVTSTTCNFSFSTPSAQYHKHLEGDSCNIIWHIEMCSFCKQTWQPSKFYRPHLPILEVSLLAV